MRINKYHWCFILVVVLGIAIGGLLGTTFIMKFVNLTHLDQTSRIFIKLLTPLTTIGVAILVYNYTTDNNRRQLLNSLDEKSGWRKKLFELAGKDKILPNDIHVLRASLRFYYKDTPKSYFDIMTKLMILYCDKVNECILIVEQKKIEDINDITFTLNYKNDDNSKEQKNNTFLVKTKFNEDIVRLFARYLLADHWEKNQLNERLSNKLKSFEALSDNKFIELVNNEELNVTKLKVNNEKKCPDIDYINKERELFVHTIKKFISISENNIQSPDF